MKTLKVLLCATLLIWGVSGTARAESFVLNVSTLGGWLDVEQAPGSNYCWAASSSNMLAYSGWNGGFASTAAIYADISGRWTNQFGNPYYAIDWWFDGTSESPASMAQLTSAGGGYYPDPLFGQNFGYDEPGYLSHPAGTNFNDYVWSYVTGNVAGNRVFTMNLGNAGGGIHWVTGWGYDDAAGAHKVWITDSWDQVTQGLWMNLTWDAVNGHWDSDYQAGWFVRAMGSLHLNDQNVPPAGGGNGGVIPEPTSMLLLGTGLSGLYFRRRARKS